MDTTRELPPATSARGALAPTTAGTEDILDIPASVGLVTVGGESFELDFDCYAAGAGEIIAVGSAQASDGRRIEAYVQAFLSAPYVGVSISNDTTVLYEAAVDRPLDINHVEGIVRVDDVALVTDLDLETGTGIDAGTGTIVVECRSFSEDLPAGFASE